MMRAQYPDLAGRVAIVTGGATGLGEAIVRAFVAQGARVAFLDRQEEAGRALAAELAGKGGEARFEHCDLLDITALKRSFAAVEVAFGPASILVNNAAVDQRHEIAEIDEADFTFMMDVNLRHVMFASQAVIPGMRTLGGGSIINVSSVAWMRGVADLPLYSAAKAAIVGLTHSLARKLGPDGIRVNAIAPGHVPTPRQRALWFDPAKETAMLALQCLPQAVEPGDVAELALFLAAEASRRITKQVMVINAGSL